MLSHKLPLDDVDEKYLLIAIHSPLEDYKIAYYLNKHLQLNLKRSRVDVDFNHGPIQAMYPLYVFQNKEKYCTYYCVKNKYKGPAKKVVSSGSLFVEEDESPKSTFLIPEHKGVDYFLKIEEDMSKHQLNILLSKILSIPFIVTSYLLDANQLKSKNNLILE